jgi:hypothetical protein
MLLIFGSQETKPPAPYFQVPAATGVITVAVKQVVA